MATAASFRARMMEHEPGISRRPYVPWAAAALAVGVAVAGALIVRDRNLERAARRADADLVGALVTFSQSISEGIELVTDTAARRGSTGGAPRTDGVGPIFQADPRGRIAQVGSGASGPVDGAPGQVPDEVVRSLPGIRDRGDTRVVATGASSGAWITAPVYGTAEPPRTTVARRAAHSGFVAAPLDLALLVETHLGERSGVVEITHAGRVLYTSTDGGAFPGGRGTVSADVSVGSSTWSVRVAPPIATAGTLPWVVLAGGLVVGGLAAWILREVQAAGDRARRRAEERARSLSIVADVGSALQGERSTAEILPAVATVLDEHLDLAGVSFALIGEEGQVAEAFRSGAAAPRMGPEAVYGQEAGDTTGPGETLVLPLLSGRRMVGALALRPRDVLDRETIAALRTAADLVGSATASARVAEREREALARMVELDQMRSDFLGTVSHELRTPLTAILGFATVLHTSWDRLSPDDRQDFMERITRNATGLGNMLNDLLDFSRLERHRLRVEPVDMDISAAVREVLGHIRILVDDHPVEASIEPGLRAWASEEALERVLTNLVTNSAKFSPAGSPIVVVARREGDDVVVMVDDSGPGIDPAERAVIFRRFYRGRSEAALSTRGAGVGLSIVREYVEALGGRVRADEAPTGGARMVVTLRATAPTAAPEPGPRRAQVDLTGGRGDGSTT